MDFDGIIFANSLDDMDALRCANRVTHILCEQGSMGFGFQDTRYNVAAADYVILPNAALATGFTASPSFRGIAMSLSASFVASIAMRSNYGVVGHLSLMRNPVMKLSDHDFRVCKEAMENLRNRMTDTDHRFREELLGSLLTAHILDLYDIHTRQNPTVQVSERIATLLQRFIEMLYQGEYIKHRDLDYYASRLCITPHYLSEICRRVSGMPASYWIDRFTTQEIIRLLQQSELTLSGIADRMNFSSVSYFSRYVRSRLGMSPSELRQ